MCNTKIAKTFYILTSYTKYLYIKTQILSIYVPTEV